MDWTQLAELRPWTPLFQYPPGGDANDRIVVTRNDYECFDPDAPLNRTCVDFGLRYIVADARRSPLSSDPAFSNMARDVHVFPSDFFTFLQRGDVCSKLNADGDKARRAYARVERLTRGVDVFAKKFLLVPVYVEQHWSLAIICHPGELAKRALARRRRTIRRAVADLVDAGITEAAQLAEPHVVDPRTGLTESDSDSEEEDKARSCVIHMDSNRQHNAKKIEKWLRCFLEMEWRKRHADEPPFTCQERVPAGGPPGPPADLLLAMPRVPQQEESCDSGLCTLRYAQEFLARAICGGAKLVVNGWDVSPGEVCFRDHDLEDWFTGRDIAEMRLDFRGLVRDLKREEEIRCFRARCRICLIGQRDSGSVLSRLPTEILRKLVPYFALE